ncbi:agmatinase 1 [Apiospora saccharicola]
MKWSLVPFVLSVCLQTVLAWEFPRPPSIPHAPQWQKPMFGEASPLGPEDDDDVDIVRGSQFNGLRTYGNLPYVNCLSDVEAEKGPKYDIAIMDTWDPAVLGGGISDYATSSSTPRSTPGSAPPLIRAKGDLRNDLRCGFAMVKARDLDRIGTSGVILQIKDRVGGSKVYISVDIDVLDPAFAPATGTAEPGGWSTRELLTILDGLQGLHVVGADVVEVAPIYDNPGETTVLAAAEVALSLIELMVENPVKSLADA